MKFKSVLIFAALLATLPAACSAAPSEDWSGDIFAGYNMSSGNTDKSAASLDASAAKKSGDAVLSARASLFYSQSNKKMDGQKWDGLLKYTYDFGSEKMWFANLQTAADHDRFADIDYRVTPAAGLGRHLIRKDETVWDADGSLGYEITRYRVNTSKDDEVLVFIAHTFFKQKVFENAFLSEDLTATPRLESGSGVRVRSMTALINPLSENMDLEIKYIVDYDSEPADGKSTTDKQLIAGIKYKF